MGYEQKEFVNTKELAEQAIAENPELKTTEVSPEVVSESKKIEDVVEKEEKVSSLLEKIKGMFGESKDKLIEKGIARLAQNPELKKQMDELEKTNPAKAEKWKAALGKWTYVAYDESKQEYVNAGTSPDIHV